MCNEIPARKISDRQAMRRIQAALDGKRWNADTLDVIAAFVRDTGRVVRDPADVPGDFDPPGATF